MPQHFQSLHVQSLRALHNSSKAPDLVLLHGWGMSSEVWAEWLPVLRQHCNITLLDLPGYGPSDHSSHSLIHSLKKNKLAELLRLCLEKLPEKAIYVGYSLGGMLAVNIAALFPERISALITLSSNVRFVATEAWPWSMDEETFQTFSTLVAEKPAIALKRFAGLQAHGFSNDKSLIKIIREKSTAFPDEVLVESLQLLSEINNQAVLAELTVPALCIYGEEDSLVPVMAAEKIQLEFDIQVEIITGAPHAVFLSHAQECWQKIACFLSQKTLLDVDNVDDRMLDKQLIAKSFSRAATTYDSVADLQRRVGQQLLTYLPTMPADNIVDNVVDLGCGTGFFSSTLQTVFSDSQLIGLDLAEGMVAFASNRSEYGSWLCGDAENLPLAENSIGIIFSSLAIQWCEDSDALFSEVFRVLKPGGSFVFSTLGPATLHELRNAWCSVDNYIHVNRFVEQSVLVESIIRAGFSAENVRGRLTEDYITLEYDALKHLTRELKSLGAHNINNGRPVGLTGKHRVRAFKDAYEQQRNEQGMLPATYQVWYGVLEK